MAEAGARGLCPPRFAPVRQVFEANFAEGLEIGARFAVAIEGEVVVDLIGGWADRDQHRPFEEDTLTPVFSTTKAVASFMVARCVDQGRLGYGQRVAELWPEFAAAGKAAITVEQVLSHQAGLCGFPDWVNRQPSDLDPDLPGIHMQGCCSDATVRAANALGGVVP